MKIQKRAFKESFYVLLAMAVMLVPYGAFLVHFVLLYLVVSKGNEWYAKALFYIFLMRFMNDIFHPVPVNFSILTVLFISALVLFKSLRSRSFSFNTLETKFYILSAMMFVTSLLGSMYLSLSIVRLILFTIITFTVFASVKLAKAYDFLSFFRRFSIVVIAVSFPFIFLPYGYHKGFFSGAANHSMTFGVVMAPLLVIYIVQYFNNQIRRNSFHRGMILLGVVELVWTHSRIAVLALLISLIGYYLFNLFKKTSATKIIFKSVMIVLTSIILLFNWNKIESKVMEYALKNAAGKSQNLEDSAYERIFLMEASQKNFLAHPWTGIGFGVQIDYWDPREAGASNIKYLPGTDIMYSKPLEKGNLYLATFEETGLIPGLFFLYILFFILSKLKRSKDQAILLSFVSMLVIFNAEANLFTPAGLGNYQMLLIAIFFSIYLQGKVKIQDNGRMRELQ
jgi:O-antigen ligase